MPSIGKTSRCVATISWSLFAVALLPAQTLEEAEQAIRWKLDEQGRVCVWPDPSARAADDWRPIADPRSRRVWSNMGFAGNLALLLSGDTDIVSISDARRFWERLDVGETELIRRLAEVPAADAPAPERMQFVLLIRALQDLGSKPAIGLLQRFASADDVDPSIRRAAGEAVAALRGELRTVAGDEPGRPSLATVLADCPSQSTVLLVVDRTRLPSSRPLMALSRELGLAVTRQAIRRAGGTLSPAMWAGSAQLAEGGGVLPYEIAWRFGNHRITRMVASLWWPAVRRDPTVWASLEGSFDLEALRAGLEREEIGFSSGDGELLFSSRLGIRVRVSPTRAILTSDGELAAPLGAERAAGLAAELGDMPCTLQLHELQIAELGGANFEHLVPWQIGIRLPYSLEEPLELRARFKSGDAAGAGARQLRDLSRLVERLVDAGGLPESVLDVVDTMEVEREGAEFSLRVKVRALDDAMIERLVQLLAG